MKKVNKEYIITALLDEYLTEKREGNKPSIDQYIARYPEYADDIRKTFEEEIKWTSRFNVIAEDISIVTPELENSRAWKKFSTQLQKVETIKRSGKFWELINIIHDAISSSINRVMEKIESFFGKIIDIVIYPMPITARIAIPTALAVVIMLIFLLPQSTNYSDLARIEKIPYIHLTYRGGSEPQKLFSEGMEFYSKDNYTDAITKLKNANEKDPDNLSTIFYLGLSYLLASEVDSGIVQLQRVIALGASDLLLERTHWYLGNAYLLKDDGEMASSEFQKVIAFERDYEWDAREMMAKIK